MVMKIQLNQKQKKLAVNWTKKVEKELSENIQVLSSDTDSIESLLTTPGHLKLELSWKYRGFDGSSYFIASTIYIKTSDKTALDKVIKAGNHPYWAIYYTLDKELDLDVIQNEMYKRTGDSGWVGGYKKDVDGNKISTSLEYRNRLGLLIQLHRGISGQGLIILSYLEGGLSRGFMKAHEVFTPKKLLSILYGEFTPAAFKMLVDKAS